MGYGKLYIANAGLSKAAKIWLAFTLMLTSVTVHAQTFAEWFSQKKTQKKYLIQQISALQIYSSYLQKGNRIAKGGLGSIGGYIGNEFNLHNNYYDHLRSVSVPVRNDPQVSDILRWQQDILLQLKQLKAQQGLNWSEKNYVGEVSKALLSDCDGQLHDLEIILSDQKTVMDDEERLKQIARLYQAMQDNYRFVVSFRSQLQLYVRSRSQESNEVNMLKNLYAKY